MPSILIIDDEEPVRSTFEDILQAEGHSVTTASGFEQAKGFLLSRPFDVALTDLRLPEQDGMSLLRFAVEHDPEISVVMVTGHPDLATAVEALKQGGYDYVTKPVTRQALVTVVERAAERCALLREKSRLEEENAEHQRSLERKVKERTGRLRESEQRYRDLFQETLRAYEEVKTTQEKLIRSERLAAVGELAARIAHEIRNPLGAISNSVGVLRRDLHLDGDDLRLLEVVHEGSERLERIVADFLRFARPRPVQKTSQKLPSILEDVLLLFSKEVEATRQVNIERHYEPELPAIAVDAEQTREALWNLMVNAVEAMPEGGTICVVVRAARHQGNESLEILVTDTGKGIDPSEHHRIFEPFHTTKAEGTGLGLSTVQRIIEEHSGEVEVESQPGTGSTFLLRFPLSTDERHPVESRS